MTYGYDSHNAIFSGMDGDVPISNVVQIYSKSGGGKSTFLKLLAGVCDPDEGSINVRQSDCVVFDPLRHTVNFISDMPTFLDGTLLDNLGLKDTTISHSTIVSAINKSRLSLYPELADASYRFKFGAPFTAEEIRSRILLGRIYASPHKVIIVDGLDFQIDSDEYIDLFSWVAEQDRLLFFTSLKDYSDLPQVQLLPISA